jgi:Kef-type K+ transport system membrane component KefB
MAGMVVAGTGLAHRVERLVVPLRDTFATIFFFSFGLTIAPTAMGAIALPVVIAVIVTLTFNVVAGVVAARIYGISSVNRTSGAKARRKRTRLTSRMIVKPATSTAVSARTTVLLTVTGDSTNTSTATPSTALFTTKTRVSSDPPKDAAAGAAGALSCGRRR